MKSYLFLIFSLFCLIANAQDFTQINTNLKLSDSLDQHTEIRIYRSFGATNYTSVIRMYKDFELKWRVEFYEHWSQIKDISELLTEMKVVTSKNEMDYIYLNLTRSHIFDLPSWKDVGWKMIERGEVEKVERRRGKIIKSEFDLTGEQTMVLDGNGYYFQAKRPNKSNQFEFGNPYRYKELYPDVDEPVFVCEILDIIRDEFNIWVE